MIELFNAGTSVYKGGGSECRLHEWCTCCSCECNCNSAAGGCLNGGRTGRRRRMHYWPLCLYSSIIKHTQCYNIWQGDNSDARKDMYNSYYIPTVKVSWDWYNNNYGFSDGNIDNLPYPR